MMDDYFILNRIIAFISVTLFCAFIQLIFSYYKMTDYYEDEDEYHEKKCNKMCSKIWGFCYFFCCYCCIQYKKHERERYEDDGY